MMDKKELLRGLPKIDELLQSEALDELLARYPRAAVTEALRCAVETQRAAILSGEALEPTDDAALVSLASASLARDNTPSLRPVINATGVVLHTNLGRACLSEKSAKAAYDAARGYSTLEYDLSAGKRGMRYAHVEPLLQKLTGAESALVVNNNAAAVLIILSALGQGREAIVSRGELVEIGGSFRVPEIMEQCGCRLREVGTTNKPHPRDYERAINDSTFALMKVHTSNFRIVGFTESVSIAELREIGDRHSLPVIYDMGSGSLFSLDALGIRDEPTVQESLRTGADIVSFSGDKLLGGPQAGVIVGKKEYIDILKAHPLCRALRVDKMTLAALEATLRAYLDAETVAGEIPVLRMLAETEASLRPRAERLCASLRAAGAVCEVVSEKSQVGGGSVPTQLLDTAAVAVSLPGLSAAALEAKLRTGSPPVICRVSRDRCVFDLRTVFDGDLDALAAAVGRALL